MYGMVHLDTDKEGGHDIDIPWEIGGLFELKLNSDYALTWGRI